MHFYDNLSLSEFAQCMDVPEGTVRQWKKRALATLRSVLQNLPIFADYADPK
jgi:DNA-directed RNA polymerase specialized sigma24 family protein